MLVTKFCLFCYHTSDGMDTVQVTPLRRTLVSSPSSECASCHQQGHEGSKTLLQQNPPVLNCGCRLMQVVPYNGCKMVVVGITFCSFTVYFVQMDCIIWHIYSNCALYCIVSK